jgi:hypothetical protein
VGNSCRLSSLLISASGQAPAKRVGEETSQMNLSEAANRVIDLTRKVHDYYATELPKRYPNYPLVDLDEENVPPPPEEVELREFLSSLPDELIYQLMLTLHLNREAVRTDDLSGYYEALKERFSGPSDAASRMMLYKATLADELSEGLEELRRRKVNVDKLPLKKVKVRKR